ncbi:transcriptional regulator LysR family protein [Aeromonas diversa CDC 2478-85]|uniref:Transcriptional regulator LysR family protein n=2 Tax=Aeromonas diversa TaxID=502790 RepID=N9VQ34_9GAMM|nr:transcriptional regulator LysR family protein [Aeromonas diversa CDC 2478-85]
MRTDDLKLFHLIVKNGGLVTTADMLNQPKSSVSRRLKNLEDELNVKLFHRQSRLMSLTQAGERFYERTLPIIEELESTIQEVSQPATEIAGHLRIHLLPIPHLLAVGELIFEFMARHPGVSIEILTHPERLDMARHHLDLAFALGEMHEDSTLIARPVLDTRLCFYASPDYLAHSAPLTKLEELQQHNVIRLRMQDGKLFDPLPRAISGNLRLQGNLILNHPSLMMEAALLGQGVVCMPAEMCDPLVEQGLLVRLLAQVAPTLGRCWLIYPSRHYMPLARRKLIDFLVDEMAKGKGVYSRTLQKYLPM